MKKIIKTAIAAYLAGSVLISAAYNLFPAHAWNIANHRYGLLCVGFSERDAWLLSPFCNYSDVFLFGIDWGDGLNVYSDGFDCFGEYEV